MGKFYLENRHLWEKHRRERAYEETLAGGGGIGGGLPVEERIEVRFEFHGDGRPPACLRLVDFKQTRVAVEAGNALIGTLDGPSTTLLREYFREHPGLGDVVPATLVGEAPALGLWIACLGISRE